MKSVAVAFTTAFFVIVLAIPILRSPMHARRLRRDGLGGTQDIAMWGTLVSFVCLILAAASWIAYLAGR